MKLTLREELCVIIVVPWTIYLRIVKNSLIKTLSIKGKPSFLPLLQEEEVKAEEEAEGEVVVVGGEVVVAVLEIEMVAKDPKIPKRPLLVKTNLERRLSMEPHYIGVAGAVNGFLKTTLAKKPAATTGNDPEANIAYTYSGATAFNF